MTLDTPPILVLKDIRKAYGQLAVLQGIDLAVDEGQIVGIVGKSGAGKSTLLHIAGTLDIADSGLVKINGFDLSLSSQKQLADFRNQHIGFIFQSHHLLPEFTALENVMMPALIAGKSRQETSAKAMTLLDQVGMSHRYRHKPSELSGGEQQRVAIARALINDPVIIFADEPTGNLDSETSEQVHELFLHLNDTLRQTFIIVTHNEALADICHRRIVMEDGKIISST